MKTIRLLILLFASAMWLTAPSASAAEASLDQKLVGLWEEYDPSSNFIQFFDDHTLKLYLTKEEGEGTATHYISGTWSISNDHILTMKLTANGNSMTRSVGLKFDEGDMVLIDDSAGETRHRSTDALPAKYLW